MISCNLNQKSNPVYSSYFYHQEPTGAGFYLSLPHSGQFARIQNVVSDVSRFQFSASEWESLSKKLFSRLVQLSDGSYKLYLSGRLFGGVQGNISDKRQQLINDLEIQKQRVDDAIISDKIIACIPANSYSYVNTESTIYRFLNDDPGIHRECRKITLKPTNAERLADLISFWKIHPTDVVNQNRLIDGILGDSEPKNQDQVTLAYKKGAAIQIYIAFNAPLLHVEYDDAPSIIDTSQIRIPHVAGDQSVATRNTCIIL